MSWRVLAQGQVRPEPVVVGSIGSEDPAQMVFAQHHHMVQALRRIEPISLSACPFSQGERGAIVCSRICNSSIPSDPQ